MSRKSRIKKEQVIDPETGEIKEERLSIDIGGKSKITYGDNNWFAVNQKGVRELSSSDVGKTLYTIKGQVFHYLMSILEYGNFAPFSATFIARTLEISRQSVYKAKKDLLEDGLICEAINTANGQKGVIITNILVQKGLENDDIVVINKEKKKIEKGA